MARALEALMRYDREVSWARRAADHALRVFNSDAHRVVVSSGPPHGVHLAADILNQRTSIPLVVDMRDPWSLVERLVEQFASPLWLFLARRLERRVIRHSSLVTLNTDALRRAMARLYPEAAGSMLTVMNGFDQEPEIPHPERSRFVVGYAGTIYLDRDPTPLLRAAATVVRALELSPDQLGVEFMGNVASYDGQSLRDIAAREGLERYVNVREAGTREAALSFQAGCSVLVSLPQDSKMAIPSKIFEYMLFPASILVFADPGSASAEIVRGLGGADIVGPTDVEATAAALTRRYRDFAEGRIVAPLAAHQEFSRQSQGRRLFEAVERIVRMQSSTEAA